MQVTNPKGAEPARELAQVLHGCRQLVP